MAQDWLSSNAPTKAKPEGDWFAANAAKAQPRTETAPPAQHPNAQVGEAVINAGKGVWDAVSAIPGAAYDFAADFAPYDEQGNFKVPLSRTVGGIVNASGQVAQQSKDALDRGDYFRAGVKAIETLPVIGPMMSAAGDRMEQGDIMRAGGELATNALMMAAPMAPKGAPKTKPPILKGTANPAEARAVQFGRDRGIPMDAGTVTGSDIVKVAQEKAANTFGGARTAENLKGSQADALGRVSTELLDATGKPATNPVAAGESIRATLTKQIQDSHATATKSYDTLRALEQKQGATLPKGLTVDVALRTPFPVDLAAALKDLQPLYNQLKRESELGIPMQGAKGRTLAALDGLMNGPHVAPLSVVDAALSDLKAMARGADMPELRTSGQATAAQAVMKLDAQVRAAAAKAGPNVLKALEDGRTATKQKFITSDALDLLSGEPGRIYRELTQAKDVGLDRLRTIQKHAPGEMANVGRAFLEDLFQQATSEGKWSHADKLWADWQKLGAESKKIMFGQKGQIAAIDDFMLLQKRLAEVKNPSGTAKVAGVLDVFTMIPSWAIAKMLLTPSGVKALTTARMASRNPSRASQALAMSQITRAAQTAGVSLESVPAFAGTGSAPATPSGTKK